MTFNSVQFALFFIAVLAIYYRLGGRGQNRLMVVAGSVFYAAFDWRFLGLLYLSTLVDFVVGRRLDDTEPIGARKALLATSIVVQLGILAGFKYFDFFSTNVADVMGWLGLRADPVTLEVILPVGISFYTFQTIAYVFAVYRRQIDAERDLVTFAAFVAWFPQLVAGPIERPTTLLPQIRRRRQRPGPERIESGALLILRGLFKKVVIADGVATYVNTVFNASARFGWTTLVVATVGFAVQVYGDFSGYSDIARGASRLLGVELRRNFEQPFLSRSMREFWQRWHTSLGWWFTEHVGRPLAGVIREPWRGTVDVLIIFMLIGLWHGPRWGFVFWGLFNGVLVVIWRRRPVPRERHPMKLRAADLPAIVTTFAIVCVGVVFFRAPSLREAFTIIGRIVTLDPGAPGPAGAILVPVMLILTLILDLDERRRRIAGIERTRTRARLGTPATAAESVYESPVYGMRDVRAGVLIGALIVGVVLFSGGAPTPFIYFQF
jgi:alginate O-acetyltransferase complex protein AlgI